MLKALGNETRIAVLRSLGGRVVPMNQIPQDLGRPASTATMHTLAQDLGLRIESTQTP